MDAQTKQRLFGYQHAFDQPATLWITIGLAGLLLIGLALILLCRRLGRIPDDQYRELLKRFGSWMVIIPAMLIPVLLGAAPMIAAVALLSIFCYREFCHAPGMVRDRAIEAVVYLGILLTSFAVADHWYGLFVALFPLVICAIVAVAVVADQPQGYIRRTSLGALGYMLFGCGLGHLGYMANDANYRPIVLWLLLCVEMNDVFAYCAGKLFGRRKLAPRTSPNKTIGGALGAIVLTTLLAAALGHYVFQGTPLDRPAQLIGLGVIISVAGQLGDLVLSSVKRDLAIKDLGTLIPGHGGLLDRFDSLILVAPAVFHYVGYFVGFGLDQTPRIFL